MGSSIVRGSLSKPVSIVPGLPPSPPNTDYTGCTANSNRPFWMIKNLKYRREWTGLIAGVYISQKRSLDLEILNYANGYVETCSVADEAIDGANDKWIRCSREIPHTYPRYAIDTYVHFDIKSRRIAVNQTWFCNDTEQGIPCV
jgi:hypothetical protein